MSRSGLVQRHLWVVPLFVLLTALAWSCGGSSGDKTPADGDSDTITEEDGDVIDTVDGDKPDGDRDTDSIIIITPNDGDEETETQDRGCTTNKDCNGDQYCKDKICLFRKEMCQACKSDGECGLAGNGTICLPSGLCGGGWCQSNADCREGACLPVTGRPEGNQCQIVKGTGENGQPCCTNGDCNSDQVCFPTSRKCTTPCKTSMNCLTGYVCYDDPNDTYGGYCKIGCETTKDCLGGKVCANSQCVTGDCGSKYDCPVENICNTTTLHCIAGCEDNGDCNGENECVNKLCIKRIGCRGTFECSKAQMCTKEDMNAAPADRGCCFNPKQTETGPGCATGETRTCCKNPEAPQKFCDVCTDTDNKNKECGSSGGKDNACVGLQDKDGNKLGNFCLINWDCNYRNGSDVDLGTKECPLGYTCTQMEDSNKNKSKVCLADCTKPVFQN